MTAATDTLWQVQYRKSRSHPWKTRAGRFETREAARDQARYMRYGRLRDGCMVPGSALGNGNTRVVRYEKAGKK